MDPQISDFGERSKSREGKIRVSEFRDLDPPGKVILRLSTSKQARPDLGFKYPNHFSHESRILSHQTCLMSCLWKDSKKVPDGPPKLGIRRFPQTPHKHASKSDPIWDFNLQIQTGQVTLKTLYENVFRGVTPYQSKAGKTSLVLHTNTSYLMFLS